MSLTKYMLRLNISEPDLQEIIAMADDGLTLSKIHKENRYNLTEKQIYALLAKYCKEDGTVGIADQYPGIYLSHLEQQDESVIKRGRVINRNKKALQNTYEDLVLMEDEDLGLP